MLSKLMSALFGSGQTALYNKGDYKKISVLKSIKLKKRNKAKSSKLSRRKNR
jgi:hypothetical protein